MSPAVNLEDLGWSQDPVFLMSFPIVQVEPQVFVGIQGARDADQCLGKIGIDTPIPAFACVGQGASGNAATDSHVVELVFVSAQASLDIAQTLAKGELRKRHTEILVETGEGLLVTVAVVACYATPEGLHWQMADDLRKNEPGDVHDGVPKISETGYFEDLHNDSNR